MDDDFDDDTIDQQQPSATAFNANTPIAARSLSAFDGLAKKLAIVSKDNRLKIFAVPSAILIHDLSHAQHLSHNYSAVAWGFDPKTKNEQRIALGTDRGIVEVWDVISGQQLNGEKNSKSDKVVAGHSQGSRILAVAFDFRGTLYSSASDKHVIQWDAMYTVPMQKWSPSTTEATSALLCFTSLSQTNMIVTATSKIKCFETSSMKATLKFSGHTSLIKLLKLADDKKYLFSAGNERFVSIFAVGEDDSTACQELACETNPILLDVCTVAESMYDVLVATEIDTIHVWRFCPSNKTKTALKPNLSFRTTHLISATFGSEPGSLVIVSGLFQPSMVKKAYWDENREILSSLYLDQVAPVIANQPKSQQAPISVSGHALPRVSLANGEDNFNSFEERLFPKQSLAQDSLLPKIESLSGVLLQALQANDRNQLEKILHMVPAKKGTQDSQKFQAWIEGTVSRIPASSVVSLLQFLVEKFYLAPHSGKTFIPWIHAILLTHTSYLMGVPDLVESLSGLYLVLDSRVQAYTKLLKLSGKLDLILSHVKHQQHRMNVVPAASSFVLGDDNQILDEADHRWEEDMDEISNEAQSEEDE